MILAALLLATAAQPDTLDAALDRIGAEASGRRLCDRRLAARYGRAFERRFADRIARLRAADAARHGPPAPTIVTTECVRAGIGPARHRAAMRRFDAELRALERRYAVPPQ